MRSTISTRPTRGATLRRRLLVALLPLVGASGCVSAGGAYRAAAAPAPLFDPIAFFAGRTHGTGTLHIVASKPRTTDVVGHGVVEGSDTIRLDQDVVQGEGPAKHRAWTLHRVAPGRYTGTLTDAIGPVSAETHGNALDIRFAMRHGLAVAQHLYLQPDGRVALNTMIVRKWGITIARLDERIERLP